MGLVEAENICEMSYVIDSQRYDCMRSNKTKEVQDIFLKNQCHRSLIVSGSNARCRYDDGLVWLHSTRPFLCCPLKAEGKASSCMTSAEGSEIISFSLQSFSHWQGSQIVSCCFSWLWLPRQRPHREKWPHGRGWSCCQKPAKKHVHTQMYTML